MKTKRSIGIHDGTFHADEVTACALLIVFDLIDRDKIIRSRDPKRLAECEYVCDVGGIYDPNRKYFDHHQASYRGQLSGAGMILNYLKSRQVITDDEYHHFNYAIILGVDAHDNGRSSQDVGVCTFSHVIGNFNPVHYDATSDELDEAFFQALDFTVSHLKRMHARFQYNFSCRELVKKVMEDSKICLFFDRTIPWLESFFALGGDRHPALYVVMPAGEHWKLRGIPPDFQHRMQVRLPLPENWAGLLGEDLKEASGIEGAVFCHKGRFTSVWETREDAIEALKYILNKNHVTYENTF